MIASRRRGLTLDEARALGQGSAHLDADPTYARVFVRRLSAYVSWLIAAFTPLSADAVTVASITLGTIGGLLCAGGTVGTSILAIVLLQAAYVLDVADGEVARIRGTAGLRGTYLDLIGHFIQNRALFAGAGWSLIVVTGGAAWAVAVVLLVLGFATPFGYYARLHVAADAGGDMGEHGPRQRPPMPARVSGRATVAWLYRRVSFIWNYPASLNLFTVALLIDVARGLAGATGALAVPALIAVFGPTLALKQFLHAIKLLGRSNWAA